MRAFAFILTVGLMVLGGLPAPAKVIGIIADDSGSMAPRLNLPGFGVQILAATIDGRPNRDRLLTLRMSAFEKLYGSEVSFSGNLPLTAGRIDALLASQRGKAWEERNMRSRQNHQATVRNLAGLFRGGRGTPYGPVEVMLHALASEAGEGEDAHLIIVSDGAFSDTALLRDPDARQEAADRRRADGDPPIVTELSTDTLRESYRAYRGRMPGNLRVDFLFIKPANKVDAAKLQQTIDLQGVRPALQEVFNGSVTDGPPDVSSGDTLWTALKGIIASVSATDVTSVGKFVKYEGDQVTIASPFSISRVVAVSAAPREAALPVYRGGDLDGYNPERATLEASMAEGDRDFNWLRMKGRVEHFRYATGLTPGTYRLDFSHNVGQAVFLLFEIQSTATLRIVDETGTEAPRDPSGGYQLIKDKPYTFVTQLADPNVPGGVVGFDALPDGTGFRLQLTDAQGTPDTVSMEADRAANRAVSAYTPATAGAYTATAQIRIPGFAPPSSERVPFTVLDSLVTLDIGPLTPFEPCAGCQPGQVQTSIVPGGPDTEIGRFDVTPRSDLDGTLRIDASGLPEFAYLTDAAGVPVPADAEIAATPGTPLTFRIMRRGKLGGGEIAGSPMPLVVTLTPLGAWQGDPAGIDAELTLNAPPLVMDLVSHATDPQARTPMVLTGPELWQGELDGMFRLTDLVSDLDPARVDDEFEVSYGGTLGMLLGHRIDVSAPGSPNVTAQLRPKTAYWCLCLFGIGNWITGSDTRIATLSFADRWDLQSASAEIPLRFVIEGRTFLFSCLLDLLLIFLFILFVRGLIAVLQTRRFPRNSVVEVRESRSKSEQSRFVDLRGWNWTWVRCWFALFTGPPHERASVEGLELRASAAGPTLLLRDGAPPWVSEFYGQPIEDVVSASARTHQLSWGEVLNSQVTKNLSVEFKRDINEAD